MFDAAIGRGEVLAPARSIADMHAILFNDRVDTVLTIIFMLVVLAMTVFGVRSCATALRADQPTTREFSAGAGLPT